MFLLDCALLLQDDLDGDVCSESDDPGFGQGGPRALGSLLGGRIRPRMVEVLE